MPQKKFRWDDEADYVVVGSGASGATTALFLAESGQDVLVLEEGKWYRKENFTEPLYGSISTLFRDFGMRVAKGKSVIPVLEGKCIGGTTVMNGAIIHRLPESVHAEWQTDSKLAAELSYKEIDRSADLLDQYLGVKRNLDPILDGLPVSKVLRKMGWRHQAMNRNAPGCQGSGRCLQGCPSGGKYSMERSFIPRAIAAGARVREEHKVAKILWDKQNAQGVLCQVSVGKFERIRAKKAVILAGGVLQTPQLLWRSGYSHPELGKNFQCHLGVGITGFLGQDTRRLEGPPQGIEILQFDKQNIKLATQLIPSELLLARAPLPASELKEWLARSNEFSSWTGSVRSEAKGRLRRLPFGSSLLSYSPTSRDLASVRSSLVALSELLFNLGAEKVFPGVSGDRRVPVELKNPSELSKLDSMPLDARNYWLSVGHLFGTCRMGGDEKTNVVSPRFELHGRRNTFVVDASIFPTGIGVNPQHSIMSLAMIAARRILES